MMSFIQHFFQNYPSVDLFYESKLMTKLFQKYHQTLESSYKPLHYRIVRENFFAAYHQEWLHQHQPLWAFMTLPAEKKKQALALQAIAYGIKDTTEFAFLWTELSFSNLFETTQLQQKTLYFSHLSPPKTCPERSNKLRY